MKAESLVASASINISLAFISLWFFSILKKQPKNAPIYYARCIAKRQSVPVIHSFTVSRFLPSVSWIPRSFRVTEDEILQSNGLDALVLIRLFKFGINFFVVSSIVGLVILLPVNYYDHEGPSSSFSDSMDSYTISNISSGSNRLWVHYACLWFISIYGLYLLHKEYSGLLVQRIQQLQKLKHRPDQFTVLVRKIPVCTEHKARSCCVDHFFSKHHPFSYDSCKMLYNGKDLDYLWKQEKYISGRLEDMRKKSVVKKHNREPSLLAEISLHEDKLQEIWHKIRQSQSEDILKEKELPVALVAFKSRWGAAIAAQTQQHSHPLKWITEMAPEPRDVSWRTLTIPYYILNLHKIGVIIAASLFTIFFIIPVTAVQGIAKFEKLKKWFPPARAIELIPGLRSIVTGYIPSAVLKGFIYVVPFAMLGLAKVGGSISKSKQEIKACNMVFYFLVGNLFFLSLISGSLLDEIGEYLTHPKDFPSHLAAAVSAQADFFMTYILTDGLSGFSLEILQLGLLLWDFIKSHTFARGKEKTPYLYPFPYFRVIPMVSLSILIGMVYAVVAPLLLPFLIGYFCLGYIVYINQLQNVYDTIYETCGRYWPFIHHYIFVAIILMQITMIGLFGVKLKPTASIATLPLLLVTILFNEYCKIRFFPSFQHFSIETAVKFDDLDKENGEMEINSRNAISAYRQPCLDPVIGSESVTGSSSLTQPLISSV